MFGFMQEGREYAFHIENEEDLIAFSEAERDSIYDALKFSSGGYLKDEPNKRVDIVEWNLARWSDAEHNAYYDGSIYMTLYKHNEETIIIGWECHLEWLQDHGYEILEWSDFDFERETFAIPDLDAFLE